MSDSVDSTSPGGTAAADTPPTKPSLRERDAARTGVTISEEASLFGIGDGHVPSTDATWETTEDHVTQAVVLPLLPFRSPQPEPSEVMSSSEPSESGPSFAVPTGSVSHASNLHLEEDIQILIDHPKVKRSLSRIPEFSWQDPHLWFDGQHARLCFDGQPLELSATRDDQFSRGGRVSEQDFSISQRSFPSIRVSNRGHVEFQISDVACVGGFVGSDEHHGKDFAQALDIIPSTSSSSDDTWDSEAAFRGEFIDTSQPAQDEIAIQESLKNIVETLADDYYRSYAPQRRTLAAKSKQVDRSSSSSAKKTRTTVERKGVKSTGCRGQTIDGDEGSEDEESSGNGQNSSTANASSENSLLWACPFMKWNPIKYRGSCVKKLRDIYRLKRHIQEKHFSHYCCVCFKEFRPEELTQHEKVCKRLFGCPTRPPPVGLITRDMATAINERSNTRLTSREQWERLFKIIFPHEQIPSSPYLDDDYERELAHCHNYFRQSYVQDMVHQMIHESGLGHLWPIMTRCAREQLLSEILGDYPIKHEIIAHVASEEETVDQAQPVSTLEDYIPKESQTPASRGFGYDQDGLNAIQPSVEMEVDITTIPIPEPFAGQSEIGVKEGLGLLKFIDTYDLSCSDVAVTASFEETGGGPFSRPGAGDTPWYSAQETFGADPGQMRGDRTLFQEFSS
ncbi:hypothetical protein FPRO06_05231 [Fusarium proliferatum]|nr:hypothetical protein FPRO03_08949 [Fusarium proliferatum]KAG4273876.1 hypothetical protein FPRO04_01517 [Fusarium proliferatum]KAG4287579.1 hypothetical protein FPRO06_05231 [Fusarium proliferatum]CVK90250.1 uncharacterized protein FPRN_07428 [Fusarium proliferatum]